MTSAKRTHAPVKENPAEPGASRPLTVTDLGRISYANAYAEQRRLHELVVARRGEGDGSAGHILLLEHDPPVITVSNRPGAAKHLLATPELLAGQGIEIAPTDRGGDITYHGPGQLVAYAILDLNRLRLNLRSYMRWLEQVVIDTLAEFGLGGERDACATGVWLPARQANPDPEGGAHRACPGAATPPTNAKICAMGVRVSRWVSMHGLALNVEPNLNHFKLIVPCGLAGRPVTSMRAELGDACPSLDTVKAALGDRFRQAVRARTDC